MNNKKEQKELYAALDEALDRVIKGEDINTVLAGYPRYADEIEPLLRTAIDTHKAAAIKPRPEFRQRAALEFQQAIQAMPAASKGPAKVSRLRLAWMMPLAIVVALLISGTGIVAASTNSLPGSPLYNVKLAAESVQLAFTPSDLGKAELYAAFNDRRVDELVAIAANTGDGEEMAADIDALNTRMVTNMNAISELTGGEAGGNLEMYGDSNMQSPTMMTAPDGTRNEDNTKTLAAPTMTAVTPAPTTTATHPLAVATTTTTLTATTIPQATTAPAPAATAPVTEPVVPRTVTTVTSTLITVPPATTTAVIPPAADSQESAGLYSAEYDGLGKGALTEEEQKLKTLLAEKLQESLTKLEAAWEKAPDWLKPQILRAIEIILYGYDKSISN
jgi:hypothetical protein